MVWQSGQLVLDSHGLARHWPVPDTVGHHTQVVTVQGQARHWRQYTQVTTAPVARRVTVVVDLDARNALGRDMALHIARPAFVVLPLVAWLLARLKGLDAAREVLHYFAPVGEKQEFIDRALGHVLPTLETQAVAA